MYNVINAYFDVHFLTRAGCRNIICVNAHTVYVQDDQNRTCYSVLQANYRKTIATPLYTLSRVIRWSHEILITLYFTMALLTCSHANKRECIGKVLYTYIHLHVAVLFRSRAPRLTWWATVRAFESFFFLSFLHK